MILVTLGTQDKSFVRLLEAIEKQVQAGKITDRIVVQAGSTHFVSSSMEIFDLIPMEQFDALLDECDLLITHGGVGTIMAALHKGKRIIAAPRLARWHEHHNDHQLEIITAFAKEGYLLALNDFDRLDEVLEQAEAFEPQPVASNTPNLIAFLEDWIDSHC